MTRTKDMKRHNNPCRTDARQTTTKKHTWSIYVLAMLMMPLKAAPHLTEQVFSPLAVDYADEVNPLVGTASSYELSTGNTYPAIAMPFGMNAWTPQTGKNGDGWT